MIAINMKMPKSCIECEEKGIRFVNSCPLIFDGKADIERHSNCPLREILTCKDCRHWSFDENKSILCGYCSELETETNEDFYCGDAERRE
jgi:hypothetical protein